MAVSDEQRERLRQSMAELDARFAVGGIDLGMRLILTLVPDNEDQVPAVADVKCALAKLVASGGVPCDDAMCMAARNCFTGECVALLAAAGGSVNGRDSAGTPPIIYAAFRGNVRAAEALFAVPGQILDATARDAGGADVRHYILQAKNNAGAAAKPAAYVELLRLVCDKAGLDPLHKITHNTRHVALHTAAEQGCRHMLAFLLSRPGVDVNEVIPSAPSFGASALHFAVASGSLKAVEMLLEAGADTQIRGVILGTSEVDCLAAEYVMRSYDVRVHAPPPAPCPAACKPSPAPLVCPIPVQTHPTPTPHVPPHTPRSV